MKHKYEIPEVSVKSPRYQIWGIPVLVLATWLLIRHVWFLMAWGRYRLLAILWMIYFLVTIFQWCISWLEKPFTVDASRQAQLDRLKVTVNVPVYNEDPETLDRVLYALFSQRRLPNRVQVVDDGSSVDYRELRQWWLHNHPPMVNFTWINQPNLGKKWAQKRTFENDPADIFVTLDSDTVLEARAIEEGLKPFVHRKVHSVAGFELAWNYDWNLLTRINSTRQMVWQLVTCSSQNVLRGNVLINRGTFALYRGDLIRDVLPAYLGETFRGRSIKLGDDTFLTLMALCRGRAVQQPSAICLAMYPVNLSHHIRQWTRWMRGTTLRTFWRLRYLSVSSWAWVYSVVSLWWYVASLAITITIIAEWPETASFTNSMIAAGTLWGWAMGARTLTVRRSDQSWLSRIGTVLINPMAVLWVILVLRFVRIYGTVTFLRQGWSTRAQVELPANLITQSRAIGTPVPEYPFISGRSANFEYEEL